MVNSKGSFTQDSLSPDVRDDLAIACWDFFGVEKATGEIALDIPDIVKNFHDLGEKLEEIDLSVPREKDLDLEAFGWNPEAKAIFTRALWGLYKIDIAKIESAFSYPEVIGILVALDDNLKILELKRLLIGERLRGIYPDLTDMDIKKFFTEWKVINFTPNYPKGMTEVLEHTVDGSVKRYTVLYRSLDEYPQESRKVKGFTLHEYDHSLATLSPVSQTSRLGRAVLCVTLLRTRGMVSLKKKEIVGFALEMIDNFPPAATIQPE